MLLSDSVDLCRTPTRRASWRCSRGLSAPRTTWMRPFCRSWQTAGTRSTAPLNTSAWSDKSPANRASQTFSADESHSSHVDTSHQRHCVFLALRSEASFHYFGPSWLMWAHAAVVLNRCKNQPFNAQYKINKCLICSRFIVLQKLQPSWFGDTMLRFPKALTQVSPFFIPYLQSLLIRQRRSSFLFQTLLQLI